MVRMRKAKPETELGWPMSVFEIIMSCYPLHIDLLFEQIYNALRQVQHILTDLSRAIYRVIIRGRHTRGIFDNEVLFAHGAVSWRACYFSDIIEENLKSFAKRSGCAAVVAAHRKKAQV